MKLRAPSSTADERDIVTVSQISCPVLRGYLVSIRRDQVLRFMTSVPARTPSIYVENLPVTCAAGGVIASGLVFIAARRVY